MFPQTVFRIEPHNWNYTSVSARRNIRILAGAQGIQCKSQEERVKIRKLKKRKEKGHILEPARTPRNTPVQYDT